MRKLLVCVSLLVLALSSQPSVAGSPKIDSFTYGEVLPYSVPILQGDTGDPSVTSVSVTNLTSKQAPYQGLAYDGRFKALAELVPGENKLSLSVGNQTIPFKLTYQPQTNTHFIRAVLFVDQTGDTRYETPIANDSQNYRGKYDTILKIMQSFTADWMYHYGYGRRTFNLETGPDGKVIVHVVKGTQPADYYRYTIPNRDVLYTTVAKEVAANLPQAPSVDCTVIAFSNRDPKTGKSTAYTALGGGKIALFGGACMYAFPDSIRDVQRAFSDPTPIDTNKVISDSVKRNTMWATASTSIGAMLHEMGHSMGLPHSDDPRDIMRRGIDHFGRYFVFEDPPSAKNPKPYVFKPDEVGYWAPVSAAALAPSVWMTVTNRKTPANPAEADIELSDKRNAFVITSPSGLGFVGYEHPGAAHHFVPIDINAMPNEVLLPVDQVTKALVSKPMMLRVITGDGVMTPLPLADFEGSYVKTWRFAPKSETPADPKIPLTADEVAKHVQALADEKLVFSGRNRINIISHYPTAPIGSVAYATRTIDCPADMTVHVLTGNNARLRVWINGQLVADAPGTRPPKGDTTTTPAHLNKGKNPVLIEVTQGAGPWAFYFRLADEKGDSLLLLDDGTLKVVPTQELLQPQ